MAASFSYMALKATNGDTPFKYLGVTDDGYLSYSIDEVLSPKAKFAVEHAPRRNNLVHIRSCSNNKYWARSCEQNWIGDEHWIAARATKKVDDQSVWNCTLFRMDLTADKKRVKFYHVQSGRTVCIRDYDPNCKMMLSIHPTTVIEAISAIVDYDNFVVLPRLVAFKGHNDLFYTNAYNKAARFDSNNIGDPNVVCEILTTRDGHIRIKAQRTKRFWKLIPKEGFNNWIGADAEYEENNLNQMFEVIKVEKNIVALRNLGNKLFCQSSELYGIDGVLAAIGETITKEAKLEVTEPVFSRTIKVLEYDIHNAKIYDVTPLSASVQSYVNPTNEEQVANMNLTISSSKSSTWSNSVSVSMGVKTTLEAKIPEIFGVTIEVSAETSYQHQWEDTKEETQQHGGIYAVKVPAMMTAVGTAVASKGRCDIYFTYVQIDKLPNGETIKTTLYDGFFTGVNSYNFNYSIKYIPYMPPLA